MRRHVTASAGLAALTALAACAASRTLERDDPASVQAALPTPSAFAVDSALRVMAAVSPWPGFAPLTTPLAIWDGHNTLLLRHPHPPAGYRSLPWSPEMWMREGRDELVTANSSVDVGGVRTATMMISPTDSSSPRRLAALAMHELFHVYQDRRHPGWSANEAELFTYPLDDVTALALRREETAALRQALLASTPDSAACWADAFLRVRARRFARLGTGPSEYERGTELHEGLARYVERRAEGRPAVLRADEYAVDQVRQRAYDVGTAIGTVLDELAPAWRDTLDGASDSAHLTLDGLLASALARRGTQMSGACAPSAAQERAALSRAQGDVARLAESLANARTSFLDAPGWRLVVDAADAPLFPQGFDPLNVRRLSDTDVLHGRFIKLGNAAAQLQVLGRSTLTTGVPGKHPLFNGVRQVLITGLGAAPAMSDSAGAVVVRADGVIGFFPRARVTTEGQEVRVTLP